MDQARSRWAAGIDEKYISKPANCAANMRTEIICQEKMLVT